MQTDDTGLAKHSAANNDARRVFSCLEDLIAFYGRTAPCRKAILSPGAAPLTYGALWSLTNDAVRGLRSLGIGRSDRVAVVLPDGPEAAVAIMAVACGAVCVPLYAGFTADEWQRYFTDLRVAALLTRADVDSAGRDVARRLRIPVVNLSPRPGKGLGAFSLVGSAMRPPASGDSARTTDDAFILLTSGTTSRPKMVPLTHANVCLSAYNVGAALALAPRDRLLSVLPLFHGHGLISGVLAGLAAGSSVVCTPGFDAADFFGWLTDLRPTWYTAVPAIHRALLSEASRHKHSAQHCSLRLIRSASSSLPPDVLGGLEAMFGVPVIETYGMTEAATQIAANPLERRKPGSVGTPAGAEVAIMDGEGRRVPSGERGEIVLRGPTITRGYDNDATATASAFRDGWFRTGDLGYVDQEGYLFIVGRIKKADIINRGGQKVAPAEVEEALLSHPDVVNVIAFPIPHRRLGEDVAVVVVLRRHAKVSAHELRRFASERLAAFKIPGLIRFLPEIPKGPGGKIERGALVTALSTTVSCSESGGKTVAPRSELEEQLAKTWANLLELDEIGVDQDIFALGADSLMVTQMLSRLRARYGIGVSFKDIFDAPTVATLAARLGSSGRNPAAESLSLRDTPTNPHSVRLSFQQQRIFVLSRLDPTGYNYHVIDIARLLGPLEFGALEASIARICERHEVLRSTFLEQSGEPVQTVGASGRRIERLDLRPCPKRRRAAAIKQHARESLCQSFDIQKEPPLQIQLLQLDENDHALVIKLHHLITDGWSQRLLWEELETLYAANLGGHPSKVPDLPTQYRHFVEWQRAWLRTQAAEEQLSYWRAQLTGLTELPLRTDRPRPRMRTGLGARYPLKLSLALSRGIKHLSRAHGATVYMTLLAAFKCLLYRYTGHEDIAIGSLIANRNQIEIERLIGMFANTIVLRTDLTGDPTFKEVLRRVRQVTFDAYRHQDLPIEEILQALRISRSMDRNPLFEVMFVLQNRLSRAPLLRGLSAKFMDLDPGIARFDLMLEMVDADERLGGWFEYSTDLFDSTTIARMAAHFITLLEGIIATPGERVSKLPLLPPEERKRVLVDWNNTGVDFCRLGTFYQRFSNQVERSPRAVAVSDGQVQLSYSELASRSWRIANRLKAEGVSSDVVVILLGERGVHLLAALIAVQREGGAFLPLDPTLPGIRLAQIVKHSSAPLILVGDAYAAALNQALSSIPPRARPRVLSLEELARPAQHSPRTNPLPANPTRLAYVIYTSGSTGLPKGAMVEQQGLMNHLHFMASDLQLSASDVVAQTAPQSFDISIWQFLTVLMVGGRVHICADHCVRDPALLAQEIAREGVTVLQVVPALLRAILERADSRFTALGRLRWLICTGEAPSPDLFHSWFRLFPNVPLINAYGPAECSDDVAVHLVAAPPPLSLANVPIGRPIPNTRLYVLDKHLQPVPIGVSGELCVGGTAVGRGYLNDSEQTRQSFLSDPFSNEGRERLYKTGDRARWLPDGTLEFLGRVDQQVKVRGYRIELEEIEHVLAKHPEVQAAGVLPLPFGGEARLVAHVVPVGGRQPDVNELCDFLKTRLPAYMVPTGFIFLERIPLTAHGKIDRSALAAIRECVKVPAHEFVAPRNTTEEVLTSIWAELLEVEEIGVFDNFFDLGGHSLLAGQVLARIATRFKVSLPLRAVFEAPTVAALAVRVENGRDTQSLEPTLEIAHAEHEGPQPVSFAQEHILRIERDLPEFPQFHLPFAYRLQGPLNFRALQQSLAEVVRRHDSLRTGFEWIGERPVACIEPAAVTREPLIVEDFADVAPKGEDRDKALLLHRAELEAELEAWTAFKLNCAPLFRARLLRLGPDDHVLSLMLHHIVVDGWSIGLLMEELSELYAAFATGRKPELPEPVLQFADFARWQRLWSTTAEATRQFTYWKEHLRAASPVFPTGRDVERALLSSRIAHEPIHVPSELVTRLSTLSRRQGSTLFMTLLTGFKTLLLARTGRNDICVATAMANRAEVRLQRVVGPLENTALIRTRMDRDLSFHEAVHRVRDAVLEAYAHQSLPFDLLSARLSDESQLDPASMMQVVFVIQNPYRGRLKLPGVAVHSFGNVYREGQPVLSVDRTCLTIMLKETPSGITGSCASKTELFGPGVLQSWIEDYTRILIKAIEDPQARLGGLADP